MIDNSTANLQQNLRYLALMVAAAIMFTLFTTYLLTSYRYETRNLKVSTENLSLKVSRLVYGSPEIWQFQTVRLEELIETNLVDPSGEYMVQITDPRKNLIVQTGNVMTFPHITLTHDIRDGLDVVATLRISKDVTYIWVEAAISGLLGLTLGIVTYLLIQILPIRALIRRDSLLRENEAQLRQAQKLEAVGQLTSGVAHEFNNILAVVMGNLELHEETLASDPKTRQPVTNAVAAARRGAKMTQQLLSFSNRQTLQPTIACLNDPITRTVDFLRGVVDASLSFEVKLNDQLWDTNVDIAQFKAALFNLVRNSRQAMQDKGKLIIETDNVLVDKEFALKHRDFKPGPYVKVALTDTGPGMPKDVIERASDPFFTTKPVGEGTGLGLSMVHGFATQSGGLLIIESSVGTGTTVTFYFPTVTEQ